MPLFNLAVLILFSSCALSAFENGLTERAVAEKPFQTSPQCTLLTSPPSSSVCGSHGYLTKPLPYEYYLYPSNQTVDFRTCESFCFHNQNASQLSTTYEYNTYCNAFGYNQTSSLCIIYNMELSHLGFVADDGSDVFFYDMSCYQCPANYCPQTDTANLIDNGGFELSNHLFGPWSVNSYQYGIAPGHHSRNSFRCMAACQIQQYRSLCVGQQYTYSVDVKVVQTFTSTKKPHAVLFLIFGGQANAVYFEHYNTTAHNNTWRTLSGTFNATDQYGQPYYQELSFGSYKPFEVYWDNIIVHPAFPVNHTR